MESVICIHLPDGPYYIDHTDVECVQFSPLVVKIYYGKKLAVADGKLYFMGHVFPISVSDVRYIYDTLKGWGF